MKNRINKTNVLEICLQNKEQSITNFENRVKESTRDAYSQNQSPSQSEDRTPGKIDLLGSYKNELAFAQSELASLKSLDAGIENSKVEPGAIAIISQMIFFIAVSNDKIEVNGEEVFCISTNAPIYKMMDGLQKGDTFSFNEEKYTIENVY